MEYLHEIIKHIRAKPSALSQNPWMSIASTHAQMHPRNIIHARTKLARNTRHTRDHAQRLLGAGRGREYEVGSCLMITE